MSPRRKTPHPRKTNKISSSKASEKFFNFLHTMPNGLQHGGGFRIARRGRVRGTRKARRDLFRIPKFESTLDMLNRLFWILTAITRYLRATIAHASRTFKDHHPKPKETAMSSPKKDSSFLDLPPGEQIYA
jgi:hypothetical protein